MQKLHCPIRREWVKDLPEERVRQQLIRLMVEELGYPISYLAVEKELSRMPHLALMGKSKVPQRRADLVCFAKGIHSSFELYPLLLIECKAVKLTPRVITQVTGYNHFMKAYFIALANQDTIQTGWFDPELMTYRFVDYLPPFSALVQSIKTRLAP